MGLKVKRRYAAHERVDPRLVKAISSPLRVEILIECGISPISQSEFRARQGGRHSLQLISHHFDVLVECEAIEVAFTRRVNGANVNYYEATARALFSEEDFNHLPEALKGSFSALICSTFQETAHESLLANLFDSHPERHASWTPLQLDLAGFLRICRRLDEIFYSLMAEQEAAAERMRRSGERPMHATVGMFGFQTPSPVREHDRHRTPMA
ncbi:MAG: hypothetical protein JSU06_07740 [Actinobacteria bacterium]|nr:hypothetical protein [Actinomycetota bacterium]